MQFLLIVIYVLLAGTVTVHVLLTKSDVRAALGWIAVAWLSPVFGAVLYFVFGINRVTRRALDFAKLEHERGSATGPDAWPPVPPNIAALSAIAQRVTGSPLIAGNTASVLRGGDEAYPSMLAAIRNARHSVALGSYIFRDDLVGRSFIGALIDAHKRGVEVRVLIDGIGSGYILSSPLRDLEAAGIPTARFLHTWVPWRMPFLNMRNHKKLLIVDGTVGFTGGLNIGADHSRQRAPKDYVDGVQVRVEGPVTRQLMDTFARLVVYDG
jgi:cardiolipin synthase A/B